VDKQRPQQLLLVVLLLRQGINIIFMVANTGGGTEWTFKTKQLNICMLPCSLFSNLKLFDMADLYILIDSRILATSNPYPSITQGRDACLF
jgi:hypothetical protein